MSIDGKIKAFSLPHKLKVVEKLTINKNETFQDLLKLSDYQDKLLEFLATRDIRNKEKFFDFNDMMWTLKDREFFYKVIEVLKSRFIYEEDVWKWAFYHKDNTQIMMEYLTNSCSYNF